MLKKVSFIPDKIYRTNGSTRPVVAGSYFDTNRKECNITAAWYNTSKPTKTDPTLVELENKPITNVELLSSNQVKIDNKFSCWVDGEFIFDVAYNCINNNGKLNGSFIFASIGGDVKLLRVGSALHKCVVESDRRRKSPKIKKNDFEVGGVYATPSGNLGLFLGHVDTYEHYNKKVLKKHSLFFQGFRKAPTKISLDQFNKNVYSLSLKKSTVFTEKVDSLTIPSSFIEDLKKQFIQNLKTEMAEYSNRQSANANRHTNSWFNYLMRKYCPYINMVKTGQQLSQPLDMEKYLLYV